VLADIAHEFSLQVGHRGEHATSDDVSLDLGEPQFDLVQPGGEHRDIPLWPRTARVLKAWLREQSSADTPFAFPSARGYHKTLIAIANKHARIMWAILAHGDEFNPDAWRRYATATA
jgi:integrase